MRLEHFQDGKCMKLALLIFSTSISKKWIRFYTDINVYVCGEKRQNKNIFLINSFWGKVLLFIKCRNEWMTHQNSKADLFRNMQKLLFTYIMKGDFFLIWIVDFLNKHFKYINTVIYIYKCGYLRRKASK